MRARPSEVPWPLPRAQAVEAAIARTTPRKRMDGTIGERAFVTVTHNEWLALCSAAMQWAQREEPRDA